MSRIYIETLKPYQAEFLVDYVQHRGFPGDLEQPEEPAYIEALHIHPIDRYSDEDGYNEWIEDEGYIDEVYTLLEEALALPCA